jgi:hypothetical protein
MTAVDRSTEPADVFDAHLARWEAAEADPDGTVERVARAICSARSEIPWEAQAGWQQRHYGRMAAAAIDALRPAPAAPRVDEGAVERVRALHNDTRNRGICTECSDDIAVGWPCATIDALEGKP